MKYGGTTRFRILAFTDTCLQKATRGELFGKLYRFWCYLKIFLFENFIWLYIKLFGLYKPEFEEELL